MSELFKLNEKGLYDFVGTNEDILKIIDDYFGINRIKHITQYNEQYIKFYTESTEYDEIDIERDILEDDIAYINFDGKIYNATYSHIIFFKIKDLEEPEEHFYNVPTALEQFNKINMHNVNDNLLFNLGESIYNTFIEDYDLVELALKYEYGDIEECYWRKYTFEEYLNDLRDRTHEEYLYDSMSDDDLLN